MNHFESFHFLLWAMHSHYRRIPHLCHGLDTTGQLFQPHLEALRAILDDLMANTTIIAMTRGKLSLTLIFLKIDLSHQNYHSIGEATRVIAGQSHRCWCFIELVISVQQIIWYQFELAPSSTICFLHRSASSFVLSVYTFYIALLLRIFCVMLISCPEQAYFQFAT